MTAHSASASADGCDDLETRLLEDAGHGGPEEPAVLGYDDSHGSSTADRRAGSRPACDPERPTEGGDPILETAQAGACLDVRSAGAVVGDLDQEPAVNVLGTHGGSLAPACLAVLVERLSDDEVGGRLDGRRQSPVADRSATSTSTGDRSASDSRARPRPASARIAGWRPLRQFADLADRSLGLGAGRVQLREDRRDRRPRPVAAKQLQRDLERHEPLLRPVVEVSLDPSSFRVLRLDEPGARCADRIELRADLGLEPLVLDRQADRRDGGRDEPRIVAQRWVIGDREHRARPSFSMIRAARSAPSVGGSVTCPRRVEVVAAVAIPAKDRERRIAQRIAQRVLEDAGRGQSFELDDESGDPATCRIVPQDPDQQGDRDQHPQDRQDQDAQLAERCACVCRDDRLEEEASR